ncbi:TPA: hypothetical protein ACJGOH_003907, partial [Salmonella enterica subsp. enterica serovar Thompson]
SLKTSIKTITNLSDTNCLEIHGASLVVFGLPDKFKIKNSTFDLKILYVKSLEIICDTHC